MTDSAVEPARERRGRPGGGRDARIAARQAAAHAAGAPFLTRALKPFVQGLCAMSAASARAELAEFAAAHGIPVGRF